MDLWMDIPLANATASGTYKLTFSPSIIFELVPTLSVPKSVVVGSWIVTLDTWEKNLTDRKVYCQIRITELQGATGSWSSLTEPSVISGAVPKYPGAQTEIVPFLAVGAAIVGLLGLTLVYLSLEKIQRLVEGPVGSIFTLAIAAAIFAGVYFLLRKSKK